MTALFIHQTLLNLLALCRFCVWLFFIVSLGIVYTAALKEHTFVPLYTEYCNGGNPNKFYHGHFIQDFFPEIYKTKRSDTGSLPRNYIFNVSNYYKVVLDTVILRRYESAQVSFLPSLPVYSDTKDGCVKGCRAIKKFMEQENMFYNDKMPNCTSASNDSPLIID